MIRREDIVQPGDVRIFDKGEKSLVVAIGVWAKRQGAAIHIHLTGTEKFHTTVTNQKGSNVIIELSSGICGDF